MKVMVCLKQVPHQDARLDVNADGTWIQEDNIKFEINSYDTYAVEEALRLKDAGDAEVVVVSIGPDRVTAALRTALGMGADRAVHVNDAAAQGADALGIAKILAAVAKEEGADVIFAGPVEIAVHAVIISLPQRQLCCHLRGKGCDAQRMTHCVQIHR